MNRDQQKLAFSERLRDALQNNNYPISPTFVATQFNQRYSGTPITVQSANNWLHGKALPNQDKLLLLSTWLNVSSQWLRFGEDETTNVAHANTFQSEEMKLFQQFLSLNREQQKIIQNLIIEFSKN